MENPIQMNPGFIPPPVSPVPPVAPSPQQDPSSGSGKSKWLLILIGILVFLAALWFIFSLLTKNKSMMENNSLSGINAVSGSASDCEAPSQAALDAYTSTLGLDPSKIQWVVTDKYPGEFPSDFPKYENAKVIVYASVTPPANQSGVKGSYLTQTCSSDSAAKVKTYFNSVTLAATGWQSQREALLQSNPNTPPDVLAQIQAQLEAQPQMFFFKGGVSTTNKDPKNSVMVTVVSEGPSSRIVYMTSY